MKVLLLSLAVLTAALSLIGSALAVNHPISAGVKVAGASSGLGRILVDGRGRTLYLFEKDKHGKSACAGSCAAFWPPLITSGKPLATAGAKTSLLGTTKRADGRLQVTYNHHPLYTFVRDTKKGQTNGEGVNAFGAGWDAVSASGAKVEKSAAMTSNGGYQAPGGYGNGY
jgi:predicted lipoprotein with Yx(FWY)xxD motif